MVDEKDGLVGGLDRMRDDADFIRFLLSDSGWGSINHHYEGRRDWGTKKDWIILFAGNKNSLVAREFVDRLVKCGVLERTSFRANSGTQNSVSLYFTPKNFRDLIWDVLLPTYYKLYQVIDDFSDIKYS